MDIESIRKSVDQSRIEWKAHALQRMLERSVTQASVKKAIVNGEVIETYPEDSPYPSCLVHYEIDGRPIHVVLAHDPENMRIFVITVYEPSQEIFGDDFKTRRD